MEAGVIVATIGLGATFVGLLFTAIQIRRNTQAQRARLFKDLYESFWSDPRLQYAYSLIDAREPLFPSDPGTKGLPDREARREAAEALFAQLDLISKLHGLGLLSQDDMRFFAFNIERVVSARGFDDYRVFLKEWQRERELSAGPYESLFEYIDNHR